MPPNNHLGECTLSIKQGNVKIDLKIVFGDVWFCSGQSNMERPLMTVFHAKEEIKNIVCFFTIDI